MIVLPSLKILIPYLNSVLNQNVEFSILDNVNNIDSKIILLENIRFYKEEESKELTKSVIEFRKKLTENTLKQKHVHVKGSVPNQVTVKIRVRNKVPVKVAA